MAEELKVVTEEQVTAVVKRVGELNAARAEVNSLRDELTVHQKDLANAEKVFGVGSNEYQLQKGHVESTEKRIDETLKKVEELSFKKSELKPVLDELAKKFEEAYKNNTIKEYHIQVAPLKEGQTKPNPADGKKVYKKLLDYLYHNVSFDATSAIGLMLLVRNMEENRAWTQSPEFDNVIILRANNIINLWKCIMKDFQGKGFYEAKDFLDCWTKCGQSVSDAVREIQKDNDVSRQLGSDLNSVEDEFNRSEDDLPKDEGQVSTKDEVDPDV
jgi:hypothetical protein